ncbi:Uncharacterised protein [Mycobacteroides abscessus subsp. abscessus]|nr:Uncharacterised protein [Mycobacteroides abscessus subsp. abscessus]
MACSARNRSNSPASSSPLGSSSSRASNERFSWAATKASYWRSRAWTTCATSSLPSTCSLIWLRTLAAASLSSCSGRSRSPVLATSSSRRWEASG